MASFSSVTIVGNLFADPDVKTGASGVSFGELRVAYSVRTKRNGEWTDEPVFISCKVFGKTAEVAQQYLSKGSGVLCSGELRMDQWEKDGEKRSKLYIHVERMQMLDKKGEGGGQPQQKQQSYSQPRQPAPVVEEEIPF